MTLPRNFAALLLAAFLIATSDVGAAEGGDNSKSLLSKVDVIVVNLTGPTRRYLQVEIVLKLASPEVGDKIKTYMPVIRNRLILLLSNKSAEQLGPIEGKQKLVLESRDTINQGLGLTEKNGVTEVLFESFIIQ